MNTVSVHRGKLAELDLASDLSVLTTRLPGQSRATATVRRHPIYSLLDDSFSALTEGQAGGVAVTYGKLRIEWRPDGATYQLNLDAFRFIHTVAGSLARKARMLDVGSGTGVLGLGIAAVASARHLCLLDYSSGAMQQAQANCRAFTERNPDVMIRLVQGRFSSSLLPRLGEFDVLISNPPYFPTSLLSGATNRTRLTDDFGLTASLISDGLAFAPEIFLMYSSAAEPEIADMLAYRPPGSHATVVAAWYAPFPAHLLTPLGRQRFATSGPDHRWEAWHEVRVLHLSRSQQ